MLKMMKQWNTVQQQSGIVDCGVFVIAFAVHAALGENVGEIEFQQEEMRF